MGKTIIQPEIRLEIIQRYENNEKTMRELAREYHVSCGDIQKWRDAYREHGVAGIAKRTSHESYTGEFKANVVEYMHQTGASLRQTAAHFNIPCRDSIRKWERIYYEEGRDALFLERRGRSRMRKNKPKLDVNQNEDLLAEVQRLRMENEYLKKLNALIQEREKSEKKTK